MDWTGTVGSSPAQHVEMKMIRTDSKIEECVCRHAVGSDVTSVAPVVFYLCIRD